MNVLVTGASGLVGYAICNFFLEKKYKVTGIVNRTSTLIKHENYKEDVIDLFVNGKKLNIYQPDLVIHCAAIIPNSKLTDEELFSKNQIIDKEVFLYCQETKTKLIYFSTAFFYSNIGNDNLNECSPITNNLKGYYLSKKNSEEYLINSTINSIIFRLSSPYGDINKQNNVMKIFVEKIKNNLPITILGQGERKQNFIHVDDISEACYLSSKKDIQSVFNLTFSKSYSMFELASYIKTYFKSESTFIYDTSIGDTISNVNFDNSKLINTLNWTPYFDLNTGLIKTLNH